MSFQFWVSTVSGILTGLLAPISQAEQDFLPQVQLRAPYSKDIAFIDRYSHSQNEYQIQAPDRKIMNNIHSSSSSFQDKAGISVYRAMTVSSKKLQGEVVGAALMYGVESFGFAAPVKESLNFIKQKTRYKFGSCGQIKLSTKRLKAQTCLTDQTKIELKSSYKLKSFTLDFKWAL